jgi:predicted nucleic acid-binding protein
MKLVCDTNVVFSALIAGGKTRELILTDRIALLIRILNGLRIESRTI